MLRVTVLCVGNLKERYWRDAVAEYTKRLQAFCKFGIVEIGEAKLGDTPSAAQITQCLDAEGKQILSKIPASAAVIAMCIEGKLLSSVELSQTFERFAGNGKSEIVLVIGGSFGLSDAVKARADLRLSMSPMTFPHQLARVMVSEQIYRAFQITNGGKYHK